MIIENISQLHALDSRQSQECHLELVNGIKKAAEVAKCIVDGVEEISYINEAIAIGDKEQMWNLLQQSIVKYRHLICLLSPITKITVITVSKDEFTITDLRYQLEVIAGFVIVHYGLYGASKIAFKENISQIIKNVL